MSDGLGAAGSWALVVTVAALLALLGVAGLALLTYLLRGTPIRHVRAVRRDDGRRDDGRPATDERLDGASPVPVTSEAFCAVAKVLCSTALEPGHRVRCFFEGDATFDALLADVARAERLVTWHVFWFKPGRLAERVADVLAGRARAGVRVLMLLDHYGSKGVSDDYVRRLRAAGVEVAVFRRPRWNTLYKAQNRMHVRAVVVDGRVGWTGGFGIDDRWLGDGRHAGEWRDTSVRVEGMAVAQLQGAFASNWGETTGELLLGDAAFALDGHDGGGPHTAGLMYSAPSLGSTVAERFFFTALAGARERLWLTTAYFVPDRHFRRLLCEASRRGVDVRVLTPGANTDRKATWYAARARYDELLDAGVRLYDYVPSMVHAKTLVADSTWCMVGTLNFDNRSMVLNDEVALLAWDRDVGRTLERAFEADLAHARPIDRALLREQRDWHERVLEWSAARMSRLL